MTSSNGPRPPRSSRKRGDPEVRDGVVIIRKSNVTRAVFRHAPYPPGGSPAEFDVIVTIDSRIVVEDVTIRTRVPSGFEIAWPGLLNVTLDGVRLDGDITSRARSRVTKALVRLLVEGDLGGELL